MNQKQLFLKNHATYNRLQTAVWQMKFHQIFRLYGKNKVVEVHENELL